MDVVRTAVTQTHAPLPGLALALASVGVLTCYSLSILVSLDLNAAKTNSWRPTTYVQQRGVGHVERGPGASTLPAEWLVLERNSGEE